MREGKGDKHRHPRKIEGRETDSELRLAFTTHICTALEAADLCGPDWGVMGGVCTELTHHLGETSRVGEQGHGTEPSQSSQSFLNTSLKSNRCNMLQNTRASKNQDRPKQAVKKGNGREKAFTPSPASARVSNG